MNNTRVIEREQSADLVTFTIKVNDEKVPRAIQVLSTQVIKEVNRIPSAKIVIRDGDPASQDFEISNQDLFVPGNKIEILSGYHSDESTLFKGIIVKHSIKIRKEGFSLLTIDCKDPSFKMAIAEKSNYFIDIKDSDVFEDLISQYAISPGDIEDTGVTHLAVVQYQATDWDFMIMRAEANGKLVIVDDETISIVSPNPDKEPLINLNFGATVLDFDAEMDGRWQYELVKSVSWDHSTQEVSEIESEEPGFETNGNISGPDLGGSLEFNGYTQKHIGKLSEQELQEWSDAKLMKSRLAKIRGRVKFQGHADPKPGTVIAINGVGDRFNGNLYVSGVRHSLAEGNWETDVQFGIDPEWFAASFSISKLPAAGLLPDVKGLQIGVVTQLAEDPESEDRIKVKLPMVNNEEEGIWARLACLDAGENRGTFFRPEIDDEVVIGFFQNDPRFPVVLGMLHSSAKPTPQEITDDNHEKGYVSREDLKMIFNDEKKSIELSTPAGKKLIMDEDDGSITIEDENGNKIKLNSDGISLESAKDIILKATGDIKAEGINVNQKASVSFKAEGSAGAEVSSSATLTIKGSLVQIN
jgi:Rhs element Vgr protein